MTDTTIDITDVSYAKEDKFPSGRPETQLPIADLDESETLPATQDANVRSDGHLTSMSVLADKLELSLNKTNEELVKDSAIAMSQSITLMVKSGVLLQAIKERCDHGEFTKLTEAQGISRKRAAEAMKYAQFASQVSEDQLPSLLMLPKRAALTLANADPEVIDLMLSDDHVAQSRKIKNKTQLSDLARALTETEDENEKLAKENEGLQRELKAVKEREQAHIGGSEYHPEVVKLRKESAILADQSIAAVSSIRSYLVNVMDLEETRDEFGKQYAAAIYPAMAHMATTIKAWTDTFLEMKDTYGINVEDIAGNLSSMEEAELEVIEKATLNMLAAEQGSAIGRVEAMIANGQMKRGRGRPSKS